MTKKPFNFNPKNNNNREHRNSKEQVPGGVKEGTGLNWNVYSPKVTPQEIGEAKRNGRKIKRTYL